MQGFYSEWQRYSPLLSSFQIVSIYFGGGTPALMSPQAIEKVLKWINPSKDTEITLEANPENISLQLMQDFRSAGINRISIGAQTFDDGLLKLLGRMHSADQTIKSVESTFAAGIENLTIDLMYDIPGQTLDQWESTLKTTVKLPISHLSLYNLTIEPHTLYFKKRKIIEKMVPDSDTSLAMYQMAVDHLEKADLLQYEISAFAKNEHESRHNKGYWTGRSFLGIGPSAFSFFEGKRFRNVAHLNKWAKAVNSGFSAIDFEEKLEKDASQRELLVIHLRLKEGVNLEEFEKRWGTLEAQVMQDIKELEEQGFLKLAYPKVQLTTHGVLFYDSVARDLV